MQLRIISIRYVPPVVYLETGEAIPAHYVADCRLFDCGQIRPVSIIGKSKRQVFEFIRQQFPNVSVG